MTHYEQIEKLKRQIIKNYSPSKIILFGSCAKGMYTKKSDIDLCIVKDTNDIRKLRTDMQLNLEYDIPLDIIIYTTKTWEKYSQDPSSFAYLINKKGVVLYG